MRFITRTIYEVMQLSGRAPSEFVNRSLNTAFDGLMHHQNAIRDRLPLCMQEFSDINLHDGVVQSADMSVPDEITLTIDGKGCGWGQIRLTFRGVRSASGLDALPDVWLYDEVDLHPEAAFEYSLLMRKSEFSISADTVEFALVSPKVSTNDFMKYSIFNTIATDLESPEQIAEFYRCTGARIDEQAEDNSAWQTHFGRFHLILNAAEKRHGRRLIVEVHSFDDTLSSLEAAGIAILERSDDEAHALVVDPDGRLVELIGPHPYPVHIAPDGTVTKIR